MEKRADTIAKQCRLSSNIDIRNDRDHRLEISSSHELHLLSIDQLSQEIQNLRMVLTHPIQKEARVMQIDLDSGIGLQDFQEGKVRCLEYSFDDLVLVPERLVVMDDQSKSDFFIRGQSYHCSC